MLLLNNLNNNKTSNILIVCIEGRGKKKELPISFPFNIKERERISEL